MKLSGDGNVVSTQDLAGCMQQCYGTNGANQEDQQRDIITWRNKSETHGSEQWGIGMPGRKILTVKSDPW